MAPELLQAVRAWFEAEREAGHWVDAADLLSEYEYRLRDLVQHLKNLQEKSLLDVTGQHALTQLSSRMQKLSEAHARRH